MAGDATTTSRSRRRGGALLAAAALALGIAGCGQSAEKQALRDYTAAIRPLVERGVAIQERLRRLGLLIPRRQDTALVSDLRGVATSFAGLGADLKKVSLDDRELVPVHRELTAAVELRRRVALLLARAVRQHLQEPANQAGRLVQRARLHEVAFQRKLVELGRRRSLEIRTVNGPDRVQE